jgi:hypothetical protein
MRALYLAIIAGALLAPSYGWGCACGCGVFDVQTSGMLPTQPGGMVFFDYDFMNQHTNWSGTSQAPAANNGDRQILTNFMTVGGQYMFNRDWGFNAELPLWNRYFATTQDNGSVGYFSHTALGDMRIRGIYSGFSHDMSSGITFGAKLPTGDYKYANFDRDTEIGTGSADILLGGYHVGPLTSDRRWDWFVNGQYDQPVITTEGYTPGAEIDAELGGYFDDWQVGGVKIAPIAQVIGSTRWRDGGPAADPEDSGYHRVILSPAVELGWGPWKLFADVGFPVYQYVNGNQLTARELFKSYVSYAF